MKTNLSDVTSADLVALAMDFADHHSHFDSSFIVSLDHSMGSMGRLTNSQRTALENIVNKWRMVEWSEYHNG